MQTPRDKRFGMLKFISEKKTGKLSHGEPAMCLSV